MVKKWKCNLWKLPHQNDIVKSRRFKKWEWICFHVQQVEEIKSWAPIFIQKFSRAKIAHYSILFIRKNKREGNFCALESKFSTFWCWWEQKENRSVRAAVKQIHLLCIHTDGNNKQALLAVELLSKQQSTSHPLQYQTISWYT